MHVEDPRAAQERKKDADHLRALAICHFVMAGLAALGIGFLALHYNLMSSVLQEPGMFGQGEEAAQARSLFAAFQWFYVIFGIFLAAGATLNLLSGLWIRARRRRLFSLVVAGLNCLQMPLGTILGVFTFIVLLRDSVRALYEAPPAAPPARVRAGHPTL